MMIYPTRYVQISRRFIDIKNFVKRLIGKLVIQFYLNDFVNGANIILEMPADFPFFSFAQSVLMIIGINLSQLKIPRGEVTAHEIFGRREDRCQGFLRLLGCCYQTMQLIVKIQYQVSMLKHSILLAAGGQKKRATIDKLIIRMDITV